MGRGRLVRCGRGDGLWQALHVADRPRSRFDALIDEICVDCGWCGASRDRERLRSLAGSPERLVDAIIRAEAREPTRVAGDERADLSERVAEWLVRPDGRGARSGLP